MRLLRFTITPVAFVPTQIDYADYRELPGLGVKVPFTRTLTQTYMQMTLEFTDVQPNVADRRGEDSPGPRRRNCSRRSNEHKSVVEADLSGPPSDEGG